MCASGPGELLTEHWKPVVGFEGLYEVSSLGRVKSIARKGTSGGLRSTWIRDGGARGKYKLVKLSKNGIGKDFHVHRLVALSFCDNPQLLPFVLHNDGDSLNNCAENLRWGTLSDNTQDARRHGTGTGKLTLEQAREIRNDPRTQAAIALDYGISQVNVSVIKLRKTFKES